MIEGLRKRMEEALRDLRASSSSRVHIFHHNDADGLTSAAILTRAFERDGYTVHRSALEKPYPAVLEKVFHRDGEVLIFADFAGRIAPYLSALNQGRNLVLILDHHTAVEGTDPRVHNLDPDLFGLKGDVDISASVTCHLFAKAMDERNADLAHLAALGAIGDKFFLEGRLVSENRKAVLEAVEQETVRIEEKGRGEDYLFRTSNGEIPGASLAGYLETLGAVGYYQDGPETAIEVCLKGISETSDRVHQALVALRDEKFRDEIERLRMEGLTQTTHLQWFHVRDRLSPMGVKMIGVLCETLKDMDFVDPGRYLAGFQIVPDEVPGFGRIEMSEVKISMRVSRDLEDRIRVGKARGLNEFLPEATERLGGFVDACHRLAAATTVAIGKEERLIEEMERILGQAR